MKFIDQLHRTIQIDNPPKRIVSIVPSQTELLFDLGLDEEVIGITKFCIHPDEWFHKKTRVGGTKQLKMEVIEKLNPDLIIANKEENDRGQLEEVMQRWPVWISDIKNLSEAILMIGTIGQITGKEIAATEITHKINSSFNSLSLAIKQKKTIRAAYIIWNDPIMCAGGDTFIHDMMNRCGLMNVLNEERRYPVKTIAELGLLQPEYILLSSEPFPFKEHHKEQFQMHFPECKIILVDGEYFSWYGSRLIEAPAYFNSLMQELQ